MWGLLSIHVLVILIDIFLQCGGNKGYSLSCLFSKRGTVLRNFNVKEGGGRDLRRDGEDSFHVLTCWRSVHTEIWPHGNFGTIWGRAKEVAFHLLLLFVQSKVFFNLSPPSLFLSRPPLPPTPIASGEHVCTHVLFIRVSFLSCNLPHTTRAARSTHINLSHTHTHTHTHKLKHTQTHTSHMNIYIHTHSIYAYTYIYVSNVCMYIHTLTS